MTTRPPMPPRGCARAHGIPRQDKACIEGWIDIQDEGSQLTAQISEAQARHDQVIDSAPGRGGAAGAGGRRMRNKGRIVAMDIDGRRLEKARPKRLQQRLPGSATTSRPAFVQTQLLTTSATANGSSASKGTFDLALADVPLHRQRHLAAQSGHALARPAHTSGRACSRCRPRSSTGSPGSLKPGGRLVYATCSLLPEENERQVEAFCQRHPEFTAVIPEGTADLAAALGMTTAHPYMRLTPLRHNTDGFFAAVLQKAAG